MADVKFSAIFGGGSSGGPMEGAPFIGYRTGVVNHPHYVLKGGTTLAVPGTRMYYAPFYVMESVTFSSIRIYNQGTGDNGDTLRLAIYANDGSAGPGTLIQDLGQITLTAAEARRTITTTIDLTAYEGQWVWVMFHANQSMSMYEISSASAGNESLNGIGTFGTFGDAFSSSNVQAAFAYVDTAYGAAASTAVAPTTSTTTMPAFGLVK